MYQQRIVRRGFQIRDVRLRRVPGSSGSVYFQCDIAGHGCRGVRCDIFDGTIGAEYLVGAYRLHSVLCLEAGRYGEAPDPVTYEFTGHTQFVAIVILAIVAILFAIIACVVSGAYKRSQKAVAAQAAAAAAPVAGEAVTAPMPGNILKVNVTAGQAVKEGDVLVVLEAMKMENEILAPKACTVKQVLVSKGATVDTGATLVVLG